MTKVNTYIRKFTEGSERSGVLSTAPKLPKKKSATFKISELDRISYLSSSSRRSRGMSNRSSQLKEPKSPQTLETCPLKSNSIPKKEPVVQDSPRMREFFNEVRERELKCYYLQMKAAQRVPDLSHLCSDCGLPKRDKKDLSLPIKMDVQFLEQEFSRLHAVFGSQSMSVTLDGDVGGQMPQEHAIGGLVHRLATGTTAAHKGFLDLGLLERGKEGIIQIGRGFAAHSGRRKRQESHQTAQHLYRMRPFFSRVSPR